MSLSGRTPYTQEFGPSLVSYVGRFAAGKWYTSKTSPIIETLRPPSTMKKLIHKLNVLSTKYGSFHKVFDFYCQAFKHL